MTMGAPLRCIVAMAVPALLSNAAPDNVHQPDSHGAPTAPLAAALSARSDHTALIPLTSRRLPGFAAELAERKLPQGPDMWPEKIDRDLWMQIATAEPAQRQNARWNYALNMFAHGRAPEALGALDTMLADDPDLALVPAFRLALGATLVRLRRDHKALEMLTDPMLTANGEACMWRMLALDRSGRTREALTEVRCAVRAINQRKRSASAPFVRAAADAAVATGRYRTAIKWLEPFGDGDSAANLLRGRALIGLGDLPGGRLRLDRVRRSGTPEQKMDAELSLVEALTARKRMPTAQALKHVERILFLWRGGDIEQRALALGYRLAQETKDDVAILHFGGMVLRYGEPGAQSGKILEECQQRLFAILSPENHLKLADAAGLFWDNRDLAPTGPAGDRLLDLLASRLAGAGLYERAADLLAYQMRARAKDVEKGPVSERVARYYLLAGYPGRAILALRESDLNYPPPIVNGRHRLQALALYQLGKTDQALAILDAIPDTLTLRAEILWRRRDWQGLISKLGALPRSDKLSPVQQAVILRQAVALAMVGQEAKLTALRVRYGRDFAQLPSAAAFDLLTGPVDAMTSDAIAAAMAAIPTVSAAGEDDSILDTSRHEDDATPTPAQTAQPHNQVALAVSSEGKAGRQDHK